MGSERNSGIDIREYNQTLREAHDAIGIRGELQEGGLFDQPMSHHQERDCATAARPSPDNTWLARTIRRLTTVARS